MISTKLVELGYKITVIDNLSYSKNSLLHLLQYKNFEFINADATNKDIIKKIIKSKDFIIPLAALVGAPLCEKNKFLAKKINVNAIKIICNLSKINQKIIYLTTNSGYGVGEKNRFCDETSLLKPVSFYGKTKNEAEKIIVNRGNQISFRLATVFGYSFRMRTDLLVNFMTLQMLQNKKIKIFEPNFRRNFIHINDVVRAIVFSINNFHKLKNNVYNLGLSNANITKIELAKKIQLALNNKSKIQIVKNVKDPDQRDYYVSNKKIEKKGFFPKISLDQGIEQLIKIFKIENFQNYKNNY
jgi:nucleoside-diphosphate-sugar epimerase